MVIAGDAAGALLTFPRTIQRVDDQKPVPFQAKGFLHLSARVVPSPQEVWLIARESWNCQRVEVLGVISVDERQELVDKSSGSFLTPQGNDSEMCSTGSVWRPTMEQSPSSPQRPPAHPCILPYLTSLLCPNSPLPHIASWHHSLNKLLAPTSLCQGLLLWGIQTRRVNRLNRFSYTRRYLYFAFAMEGELAGYRILNSQWNIF